MDFFTLQVIYIYSSYSDSNITSMLFLNYYKLFILKDSYITLINLITNECEYNNNLFNKFHTAIELKKLKLKNFGECILEISNFKDYNKLSNYIGLFYFNKNVNNEKIKKIKNILKLEKKK